MRRTIKWPDGKLIACTFLAATEAFHTSGRFKHKKGLEPNLASLSHSFYGGQRGLWRLMEVCERNDVKMVVEYNGLALEKWPDVFKAAFDAGHELCGHGYTNEVPMWKLTPDAQREDVRKCQKIVTELTGKPSVGWVGPGGMQTEETLGILADEGFKWSGDQCDDDIPYVVAINNKRICVTPKVWYANDWRAWGDGFRNGDDFFRGFKNAFDMILEEARGGRHGRIEGTVHAEMGGRPHLASGFEKMMKYVNEHRDIVWVTTREEIADWCLKTNQKGEEYRPYG
jgi:peptidoglycan/xylan/chitin deacetylase (PgdA/CDA1 family)